MHGKLVAIVEETVYINFCEKLEARFKVNKIGEPHVPFGGVKNSGMGREGGRYSMAEMTELKWITIQLGQRQFPF
jgi:Aldehyde dehydrogenase family